MLIPYSIWEWVESPALNEIKVFDLDLLPVEFFIHNQPFPSLFKEGIIERTRVCEECPLPPSTNMHMCQTLRISQSSQSQICIHLWTPAPSNHIVGIIFSFIYIYKKFSRYDFHQLFPYLEIRFCKSLLHFQWWRNVQSEKLCSSLWLTCMTITLQITKWGVFRKGSS